ncbi:MAG: spore maturation protein [Clostridia bacterium]|nr:spore maturation protein [Clostridia bacterium]
MESVSLFATPFLVLVIITSGLLAGQPVYEQFVEGAMEGLHICVRILPYVLGMMVAIALFRSSGALDSLSLILRPVCAFFHIPPEVLPLAMMRPLSGSGALAITADIINTEGPDSYAGLLASVMQGSTDTTMYILAVYFGSVGVKKFRYAVTVGLSADLVSFIAAAFACNMFFGS